MYNESYGAKYHLNKVYFPMPKMFGEIKLYQLGRMYCAARTNITPHIHFDFYELTVVTGGRGRIVTNGVSVEVRSGDIYVSFAADVHEIISDEKEPLRYDFVAVQTTSPSMHEDLERIVSDFHGAEARIIRNENIANLVSSAIAELTAESEYSEEVLGAIFTQVLAYVIREFHNAAPVKYSKGAGEAEVLCYQIMHYIDTHIYTMKHLTELCEVMNYSYNYLSNLYKRVTSDTLANYFRNRRLEAARLLLLENDLSVTEVAAMLNYSSVYIFSRTFKEKYGFPPSKVVHRSASAN